MSYKGLELPAALPGDEAGAFLRGDLMALADRADPSNFAATTNPSSGDDGAHGYEIGSMWVNTSTKRWFVCTDNATAAAVWLVLPIFAGSGLIQVDTGGDPRGTAACDFQLMRGTGSQIAYGTQSFIAGGKNNTASGTASHASGFLNTASATYSHAQGTNTSATGYGSHSEGGRTTSSNNYTHAEGSSTTASGYAAHAEGKSAGSATGATTGGPIGAGAGLASGDFSGGTTGGTTGAVTGGTIGATTGRTTGNAGNANGVGIAGPRLTPGAKENVISRYVVDQTDSNDDTYAKAAKTTVFAP
jgi:hypothetical protein